VLSAEFLEVSVGAVTAEARPARGPRDGTGFADGEGAPVVVDPVEPEVPVVSATANGTDSTAEPIPNATARAPTRPMKRPYPWPAIRDGAPAGRSIRVTNMRSPKYSSMDFADAWSATCGDTVPTTCTTVTHGSASHPSITVNDSSTVRGLSKTAARVESLTKPMSTFHATATVSAYDRVSSTHYSAAWWRDDDWSIA